MTVLRSVVGYMGDAFGSRLPPIMTTWMGFCCAYGARSSLYFAPCATSSRVSVCDGLLNSISTYLQIAVRGSLERDVPVFGKINVKKAFAYAIQKAKITKKGITAHHHARHSAATIAAGETQDMLAIQALVAAGNAGLVRTGAPADRATRVAPA